MAHPCYTDNFIYLYSQEDATGSLKRMNHRHLLSLVYTTSIDSILNLNLGSIYIYLVISQYPYDDVKVNDCLFNPANLLQQNFHHVKVSSPMLCTRPTPALPLICDSCDKCWVPPNSYAGLGTFLLATDSFLEWPLKT